MSSVSSMCHYWRHCKNGPHLAALVFEDGSSLECDLHVPASFEAASSRFNEAVGLVLKVPANGKWDGHFQGPEGFDRVTGQDCSSDTAQEAIGKVLARRQKAVEEWDTMQKNPDKYLIRELKRHDWTYQYADDPRSWSAGDRHFDLIRRLIKKLPRKQAEEIWAMHAPAGYEFPFKPSEQW